MMRRTITAALMVIPLFLFSHWSDAVDVTIRDAQVQIYFSPDGGATAAIVREISAARKEILVQAYALSSQPIVKALLDACRRGVAVQLILDKSERGEGLTPGALLTSAGVPVFLDGTHVLAHSNIIIIDGGTVITGSFAFTKAAEEANAEDLLIMKSRELAKEYRRNWEGHKTHSGLH